MVFSNLFISHRGESFDLIPSIDADLLSLSCNTAEKSSSSWGCDEGACVPCGSLRNFAQDARYQTHTHEYTSSELMNE